jgi:hypothetical protein
MLTRDKLTVVQWQAVRNTPHHIVIAVSAVGGSVLDEMLERNAGLQGIVDGMHSTHPLVRDIANSVHIMEAQDDVRAWFYKLAETQRTPATLQDKAVESLQQALDALSTLGGVDDLLHYGEFVMATASRVARAAREGDLFGIGGELVSRGERAFLQRLYDLVKARQR